MSFNTDDWFNGEIGNLEELQRAHRNRRIIEFALFARELPRYAEAGTETVARMMQSFEFVKGLSGIDLSAMASEPQFHYWTVHAHHLLSRLKAGEAVPAKDTPHLEGVPDFDRDPLGAHVKDLGRFLLVAALRSGVSFEATVPLHNGKLHLPGLNMMIQGIGGASDGIVTVRASDLGMFINGHPVEDFKPAFAAALTRNAGFTSPQVTVLPFVQRGSGSFAVNAIEPYWERSWVSSYRNPDGSRYQQAPVDQHEKWATELGQAMDVLVDCWPKMEAQVAGLLRVVIPVRSARRDLHMSCSSEVFRFAVLLSEGDPETLAEALIHELGHNLLNIFMEEHPIFKSKASAEEILYSPWRDDARHMAGVLHAAFVFERVCEYYRRYLKRKENRRMRKRYALMSARISLANEVLASDEANLTPHGVNLVEQINARSVRHALESGFRFDASIHAQLREHYQNWTARYPSARQPKGSYATMLLKA